MLRRRIQRRVFLKITAAGGAALALPWTLEACGGESEVTVPFFSSSERAALEAAAERLVPPVNGVGPREAHAVEYIERTLTAFDHDPPRIFAGGPYSGRHPYGDHRTGRASHDYPADRFRHFLPLSRVQEIAWRVRLYGSEHVEGGDYNDAVLGPTVGWRETYGDGLKALEAASRDQFGSNFVSLEPAQQDAALAATGDFVLVFKEHLLEGMYADPVYGGNHDRLGWRSVGFDGDSQPLGFSIYNSTTGGYGELPDAPLSGPNPDEELPEFDDDVLALLDSIASGTGGKRFF